VTRRCALLLLLAAGSARALDRDVAPPESGLTVSSPAMLAAGRQSASAQLVVWGNYPVLSAGFAEGLPGRVEVTARGLFDHRKVVGFGEWRAFDFDEFEGAARWSPPTDLPAGGLTASAAGFSRMYTRQKYSDGRYSFWALRFWWAEALARAGTATGPRVTLGTRWLRTVEARTDTGALLLAAETPPVGGLSLLADSAWFLANPLRWGRPWAAGFKAAVGAHALTLYASNTWGPMTVDSLDGTSITFWNVRVTLGM